MTHKRHRSLLNSIQRSNRGRLDHLWCGADGPLPTCRDPVRKAKVGKEPTRPCHPRNNEYAALCDIRVAVRPPRASSSSKALEDRVEIIEAKTRTPGQLVDAEGEGSFLLDARYFRLSILLADHAPAEHRVVWLPAKRRGPAAKPVQGFDGDRERVAGTRPEWARHALVAVAALAQRSCPCSMVTVNDLCSPMIEGWSRSWE
jgi:hypothetical protein